MLEHSAPHTRQIILGRIAEPLISWLSRLSQEEIKFVCVGSSLLIGFLDYAVTAEIRLNVAYFAPLAVAAWYVGPAFAFRIATLSSLLWLADDIPARATILMPIINSVLRFGLYGFWILLLVRLNELQKDLGSRVEARAAALAEESAHRKRLQHDVLEISDREQRRIGQDLHDGLCQHLTGTALASHILAKRLATRGLDEAAQADRIVGLIEEAIGLARGMAKGLHPVEKESDGLMQALEEFAGTTSEMFAIRCRFECPLPVLVQSPSVATHLYRIAQEAVGNAIKHGHADEIIILLEDNGAGVRLGVVDNGTGLPADPVPGDGMGLRIMADRAKMIGGQFSIGPHGYHGCELVCSVPVAPGAMSTAQRQGFA